VATRNFHTTCWTQVLQAQGNSTDAREAMGELCGRYYQPVIAYLQRAESLSSDDAMEVAHSFFAELLSGDRFAKLEREKGLFRSYLLGALKHFLSRRRQYTEAQKRGGGQVPLSLDDGVNEVVEHQVGLPFDQQWAMALLTRALNQVEVECQSNGQQALFDKLSPWLTGEAEYGDQAELARQAGIEVNTLKSSIHRLRKRFRDTVKAEIAATLINENDVDSEMAALFEALRGG